MEQELSTELIEMALNSGACAAGISTLETLSGGPPSTDLNYVLPGARSAVTFALPLDQDLIEPFLSKQDYLAAEQNNIQANFLSSGLSMEMATYLEMKGIVSAPVNANINYRKDTPLQGLDLKPPLSHRYLAVRSGVGLFGMSGNVITPKYGAAIILGSVVTTAELVPTDPLSEADNYCDSCGLCMVCCPSEFIDLRKTVTVTMGGEQFQYSKRRDYNRCSLVCGGLTGLHRSGKWSTWSPGRFSLPQRGEDFAVALVEKMPYYNSRPSYPGGFFHPYIKNKVRVSCSNCQVVCTPDPAERKHRWRLLTQSGVVVQNSDGTLEAVSPETARERLAAMSPEKRKLYEDS